MEIIPTIPSVTNPKKETKQKWSVIQIDKKMTKILLIKKQI